MTRIFKSCLLLGLLSGVSFPASAAPPSLATSFDFNDPVFQMTVVCQAEAQIKAIVADPVPYKVYQAFRDQKLCVTEPEFTAQVSSVNFLGAMTYDSEDSFTAWSVGITFNGVQAWALYLEAAKSATS